MSRRCEPTRPAGRTQPSPSGVPRGCASPRTPTRWSPSSGRVRRTRSTARSRSGGVRLTDLVAEHGSPAYVLDEEDFRARARAFRDGFADVRRLLRRQGLPVYDGRPVDRRGGTQPRRVHRRRARRRRAGGLPDGARRLPRQQQDPRRAGAGPSSSASAGSSSTRSTRSSGWPSSSRRGSTTARVMLRVTAGVEAHTHEYIATAHEDQKFGFSISSGDALAAVHRIREVDGPRAPRAALPHRLADLRLLGLRGRRADGCSPCTRRSPRRSASSCPSSTSAAASASPTPPRTTRPTRRSWRSR